MVGMDKAKLEEVLDKIENTSRRNEKLAWLEVLINTSQRAARNELVLRQRKLLIS